MKTKRILTLFLSLAMALSLASGLSLPARAAEKTGDEALRSLESVQRVTPRDPFGFRSGSSGVSLMGTYPAAFDLRHVHASEEHPDYNYVTPVKCQDPFGTCWGFAAIAAAEVSLLTSGIAGQQGFAPTSDPEKGWLELNLSEKHLAYFVHETYHGFADDDPHSQNGEGFVYVGDPKSSDQYNTGGMSFYATGLFAAGVGPMVEYADEQLEYHGKYKCVEYQREAADTPDYYSGDDDWTIDKDYYNKQHYVLKESYLLPEPRLAEDEEGWTAAINAIKEQLRWGRAVQIGIHADTSLPNQAQTSYYINLENWAHYTYDSSAANHAVCIVGWDDNYPRENFAHKVEGMDDAEAYALTTPSVDGAWLVKNSWGSGENEFPNKGSGNWGLYQGQDRGVLNPETGKYEYNAVEGAMQTGYFWISYEDSSMDMPEALDFDSANAREGYFLYQYDYMPVSYVNATCTSVKASMANVFTARGTVLLDAVSCQTTAPGTKVTYEVYLLPAEEDGSIIPTNGTLAAQAEGVYEYGGFHRAKLDTPVFLEEGQLFSVVVTQFVEEEADFPYCLSAQMSRNEVPIQGMVNNHYGKGIIHPNESLFSLYNADTGETEWYDLSDEEVQDWLKNAGEYNVYYDMDNFPIKAYLANLRPGNNYWLTYTGQAQELVTPSSVTLEGYTAEYRASDGETWSDWSEELPTAAEVGSYTVETRYVSGDNVISLRPVTAVIQPVPVVITAKDQTIHIGDDTPAWNDSSYTVEGPEGVSLAVKPDVHYEIYQKDKKAGETVEVSKDTVRDYNIVPSGAVLDVEDESIYQIYYQSGVLTVTGVPVTVRARDVTINAGDPVPKWTADSYTVEGLAEEAPPDLKVYMVYFMPDGNYKWADEFEADTAQTCRIYPFGYRVQGKYVVSYLDGTLTVAERPAPDNGGGAAPAISGLWVGDSAEVTAEGTVTGTGGTGTASVSVESDSVVLTLTDFTYTGKGHSFETKDGKEAAAILYRGEAPLTIQLVGENSVTHSDDCVTSYGIYSDAELTILGDGSLTAAGGKADEISRGLCSGEDAAITISGCTVKAATTPAPDSTEAIFTGGDFTVVRNAAVEAVGGAVTGRDGVVAAMSYGIKSNTGAVLIRSGEVTGSSDSADAGNEDGNSFSYAINGKTVVISGGTVTGTAGNAAYNVGIVGDDTLTVTGGTVNGNGSDEGYRSVGLAGNKGVTISGGEITATGGAAESDSNGIRSGAGSIVISGAGTRLTATGGTSDTYSDGIYGKTGVIVEGGTVTATGGAAGIASDGLYSDEAFTIKGGTLTATGGAAAEIDGELTFSTGVLGWTGVTINGGTVTASGGDASASYGISSDEEITITSGTVTAAGGTAFEAESEDSYSAGINGGAAVTITGGRVIASAGAAGNSAGISCTDNTTTITGGTVTAFGETAGIDPEGTLIVSRTNLAAFLTGDDAASAVSSDPATYLDSPTKYVSITYRTSSGGGGGGGGAAPASNPVTVPAVSSGAASHGKVTSSAASAKAGDKVTLTPQPDEGYVTAGVTVTDAKGNTVPVTKNADGTYSFTMPATAVTITPEFEKIQESAGGDVSDRFKDVKKDAWYHDAVQWAVDQGLMNGVSDTKFAPNDNTTRAMVVTMLWRLAGEPAASAPAPFTDVSAGAWYAGAVAWAAETAAVNGTSATTFFPNEPVTREQLAAILYRYAQAQGKGFTGAWGFPLDYPDAADVSEWANEAMHWMTMNGIITGMGDGTLAPKDNATRAQIATMFMRFVEAIEK